MRLYLHPPSRTPELRTFPLPEPESIARRLRGSGLQDRLTEVAETVCAGRIPLLGFEIDPGAEIRWRRDYRNHRETPSVYFRRVPYLDFARAGDHKVIWELNRHQHLVALAQASLLTGREDFLAEIFAQLESWLEQNPVCRGINWASALEVAFRALSWIWIHHLTRGKMPAKLKARWQLALYHHGCYLEPNLSFYFSPNTHLQGEALALHALGLLFGVERWRARGRSLMHEMIRTHVQPDGGHFEQSSYYHLYSTDMFLFHAVLEKPGDEYLTALRRMVRYLWTLAGSGSLPFFGDDDGGRLFYPFGERSGFARATLAAGAGFLGDTPSYGDTRDLDEIAAWWLADPAIPAEPSPRVSEIFEQTGTATLVDADTELIAPVRAFGRGPAGHSHAHALHFILRHRGQDVLIDPGTYTYISDPQWRDRFRGTSAHNTVAIDGLDQADPAGPFRWLNPPDIEILDWSPSPWRLRASCRYRGIVHDRSIIFSQNALWILDHFSGAGRHRLDQFWHLAQLLDPTGLCVSANVRLVLGEGAQAHIEEGWHSPAFGVKLPHPVVRVTVERELPCRLAAVFDFLNQPGTLSLEGERLSLGNRQVFFTGPR